jgi:glycosyltransferase involved in cell wall biosynthesis
MKILAITAFYPPHHSGGYELRCKDVLEGLKQRGHDILVLTSQCPAGSSCDAHPNEDGVLRRLHHRFEHTPVLSQIISDCIDTALIERVVKDYQPDLIYLWHIQNLSNAILPYFSHQNIPIVFDEGGSNLIYLSKVHKRGIYFYQNDRDFVIKKLLKKLVYLFARLASANRIKVNWTWPKHMDIYFNSQSSLDYARMQGAQTDHAQVIYSGIDISKFPYTSNGHLTSPVKIIAPGRIKEQKGLLDAVFLAKELVERKIPVMVIIAGKVQSESYYQEILREISACGLGDVVQCQPMLPQEELSRLYRDSDFCFFPSYQRYGFSRIPLEAMASGCVVITYGNEGSKEVINHKSTGLIVPEGNVSSAADWIETGMNKPFLLREITQTARQKIETQHTTDGYIHSIEMYLQHCIRQ